MLTLSSQNSECHLEAASVLPIVNLIHPYEFEPKL